MKELILGQVRHIASAAGGLLVSKGWIQSSEVEVLAGAIAITVGMILSAVAKRRSATAAK